MRIAIGAAALTVFVALHTDAQQRQSDASFKWTGRVASGRTFAVENLNGSITVGQTNGDNVEVTATKQWRRGDPASVRILTTPGSDGGMTVCALWDDRRACDERQNRNTDRRRDRGDNDNDVSVEFHVLLPHGVKISARTVNGTVTVDGATVDVDATVVNGEVEVSTSGGRVNATNVNGSIRARLGRLDPAADMRFTTVNGNVTLELPADAGADVDVVSVMGSLNTAFEMTLSNGRIDRHRIRSHIGRPGGPNLRISTVNGNVDIRKR